MNTTQIIGWFIWAARQAATLTPTAVDDRVLEYINKAYDEYLRVHGTPVTKTQLDELRTHAKW